MITIFFILCVVFWLAFIIVVILLGIRALAKKDLIFTVVNYMTDKAVMRNGAFRKILSQMEENKKWNLLGGIMVLGIPFFDKVYKYKMKLEKNGKEIEVEMNYAPKNIVGYDFHPQEIFSKDNVGVSVDSVIFAKIVDTKKALFAVTEWLPLLKNLCEPFIVQTIGLFEIEKVIKNDPEIYKKIKEKFFGAGSEIAELQTKYGIEVDRIELTKPKPAKPDIVETLEKPFEAGLEAKRIQAEYGKIKEMGDMGLEIRRLEAIEKAKAGDKWIISMPELSNAGSLIKAFTNTNK